MVLDTIKNYERYCVLHKHFAEAFAFIEKATREDLPVGKYPLVGKELYAVIQEYTTKQQQDAKLEAHKNYIDIQYVASGKETIDVADISVMEAKTEYNAEKDVTFYHSNGSESKTVLNAGDFGIYFPNDVHAPGLSFKETPAQVKKIVMKIAL